MTVTIVPQQNTDSDRSSSKPPTIKGDVSCFVVTYSLSYGTLSSHFVRSGALRQYRLQQTCRTAAKFSLFILQKLKILHLVMRHTENEFRHKSNKVGKNNVMVISRIK